MSRNSKRFFTVGAALVCAAIAVFVINTKSYQEETTTINGYTVSRSSDSIVAENQLHRFCMDESGVRMEAADATIALKPAARFDSASSSYIAPDYTLDFFFLGSHVEPRVTVTQARAEAIRIAVDAPGQFEKHGDGWQWLNGSGAFRLGAFEARDRDGKAVELSTVVKADAIRFELGAAAYPVTISAAGNRYARLTACKGIRYVRNYNGALPEAQFLVNGEVVEMYAVGGTLSNVPESDWWRGCSPTSAGMMMGHYDLDGYSGSRYDNLVGGGDCELVSIGVGDTLLRRAIASTEHSEDFFIYEGQIYNDRHLSGRAAGDYNCLADFMGTSQDEFNNADGYTKFFFYTDGRALSHSSLISFGIVGISGLVGISEYISYRGYEPEILTNQYIQGHNGNTQGFTLADFQAEIDAGRPVIIHITGHSMLGYGYAAGTQTIYVNNTWGRGPYEMTWGGSYSGRQHFGVSTVRIKTHTQVAPSVNDISVSINEGDTHEMTLTGFEGGFDDNNGDDITAVRIESLPANGTLTIGGNAVSEGDVISSGTLVYTHDTGFYGDDSFSWTAKDHNIYASAAADYSITIVPENHRPTSENAGITVDEDNTYTFSGSDFPFSDEDGDTLDALDIVSLPSDGSLAVSGNAVSAGDVVEAICSMTFTPDADEYGSAYASFTFRVGDSYGKFSEAIYTMTINVNSVNDAPVAQAAALPEQADPNETVSLSSSGSYDPDNGPQPLSYSWEQVTLNSPALAIDNADQAEAEFTTATPGTYRVRLTVYDGEDSDTDEVDIVVGNVVSLDMPPAAGEGSSQQVTIQLPEQLDSDVTVQLSASPSGLVDIPSSVQIPAGQLSVDVTVLLNDDDDFNGDRDVTIGVSGERVHNGFSNLTVEDDDIPHIAVTGNATAISSGQEYTSATDNSDFGTVMVGQEVVHSFTISNTGTGPLSVSAIRIEGDSDNVFATAESGRSVERGETFEFSVRMSSSAAGSYTGTVVIESNDPETPRFTFVVGVTATDESLAAGGSSGGSSSGCSFSATKGSLAYYFPLLLVLFLVRFRPRKDKVREAVRVRVKRR